MPDNKIKREIKNIIVIMKQIKKSKWLLGLVLFMSCCAFMLFSTVNKPDEQTAKPGGEKTVKLSNDYMKYMMDPSLYK